MCRRQDHDEGQRSFSEPAESPASAPGLLTRREGATLCAYVAVLTGTFKLEAEVGLPGLVARYGLRPGGGSRDQDVAPIRRWEGLIR
jgi:hypothetical protein